MNEKFDTLYMQRASEEVEDKTPRMIPTRRQIAYHLSLFFSLFNYHASIYPDQYRHICGEIAEIVSDTVTIVKGRKTRKENGIIEYDIS